MHDYIEDHAVKHHVQSYVLLVGLLLEILSKSLLFPYTVNALNELKYFFFNERVPYPFQDT